MATSDSEDETLWMDIFYLTKRYFIYSFYLNLWEKKALHYSLASFFPIKYAVSFAIG